MAYERATQTQVSGGEDLASFVTGISKMFSTQIASRNAEDETRFNQAVLEQNLSLDDQLSYRKEQLKRVSDDPQERKRVREEIATLKDRVEQKKFADDYLGKLIDYSAGASSIDSVISWLESQKSQATDETIKSSIQKALVEKKQEKFDLDAKAIANQTNYAINDKTADILDSQITRVQAAKNKALLSGSAEQTTLYDLQLQALTQAKTENSINKDIQNFALATVAGYSSATKLLDAYNDKLASSATTGSIKIGDNVYNSPQEFWRFKRDSYISDSSDKGFFSRFSNDQNTDIKVKNSQNNLTAYDVAQASQAYQQLLNRPELTDYQNKINAERQNTIQTGTDLLADKAVNDYATDYDINKATSSLNIIKNLGGNVDAYTSKVLLAGAQVKQSQVNSILTAAQELMKANPSMTAQEALDQATKSGAGSVLSPAQLATKSESQIAAEQSAGAAEEKFGNDPRTTAAPANVPATPPVVAPTSQNVTGQYVRRKNTAEVYDISGGTPRYITFEEANKNNIWQQIKDVDQIPGLSAATPAPTPTPATPATPVATPAAAPTPNTPDQTRIKRSLVDIYNERTDVQKVAKTIGGDPLTKGTAANNWLNNWWNTSGKNEFKNVDLI
jgi:hypothetical protein